MVNVSDKMVPASVFYALRSQETFAVLLGCLSAEALEEFGKVGGVESQVGGNLGDALVVGAQFFSCNIHDFFLKEITRMLACRELDGVAQMRWVDEQFRSKITDFVHFGYFSRSEFGQVRIDCLEVIGGDFVLAREYLLRYFGHCSKI